MQSKVLIALAILGVAAAGQAAAQPQLRQAEIIDPSGFERPVVATRINVPAGWRDQGGVVWDPQTTCTSLASRFDWAAWSPDGRSGMQLLPNNSWQMSNMPIQAGGPGSCPNRPFTNVRQYLDHVVGTYRPGAAVLDYRDRPDIAAASGLGEQRTPMPMGELRQWPEAAEMLIGYTYNGVPTREVLQSVVIFNHSYMQGMAGMGDIESLNGIALPVFTFRAPDGQLDFGLVESLRASIAPDPDYTRRMAAHHQQIAGINARGAAERADMTRRTNNEIMEIQRRGYEDRQAIIDRGNEQFSRTIREVEVYDDPLEGRIELPSHYDRTWALDGGGYLQSNDALLDPWVDFGLRGTELERVE